MALAARLRADDDIHASLRAHADPRLLVGRADRGFDVVRKPAAEELASFRGRAAARIETLPIGDVHRPVHVLLVAPAVVGHADGVAVGHRFGTDEILAAKRDAVDAELIRRGVDEPLDRERHLRPPGAAIGVGGHGIGIDRHRAQRGARDGVGAHDQPGSLGERRERDATRAHIADVGRAHGEKAAVSGERQLDLGDEVTSLVVAEERLGAGGGELDRAAELARGPQHQAELDERAVARAEIAADVVGEDAQLLRRDAEHGGKLALLPHRAAAAGMERVAPARCVVFSERGSSGTPVTRSMWKSMATMRSARANASSVASRLPKEVSTAMLSATSLQTAGAPDRMASSEW